MIYTLTLNPAIDYVVGLDTLHPGTINRLDRAQVVCGGKGINVSTMLHRLGADTTALGFAAGFTDKRWYRVWRQTASPAALLHCPQA